MILTTREETFTETGFRSSNIRWRSITAGWLVAAALAMVLYAIGAAAGVTAIDLTNAEALNQGAVVAAVIWVLVTWVVALYLGSYFASAGSRNTKKAGGLNGVGIWALSNILTILVGVAGIGATAFTGMMVAGQASIGLGVAAQNQDVDVPEGFQAQIKQGIAAVVGERSGVEEGEVRDAIQDLDSETLGAIGTAFIRGDADAAKNSLAIHTDLSRQEVDRVAGALAAQAEETKTQLQIAADKIATYTSAALWSSIAISLLALLAAYVGGRAGAKDYVVESHPTTARV